MTINQTIGNLLKGVEFKDTNAIINIMDWEKLMFAIGELQGQLSFYEIYMKETLKNREKGKELEEKTK